MKPSICIDAVFSNKDFLTSMKEINEIGLSTFEFWRWWDKDIKAIKNQMIELNMTLSTMCTKFISLTDASKHDDYLKGLKESIEAAKFLGCTSLISQVGNDTGEPRRLQHNNIVKGIKLCVPFIEAAGITLLIEPLNTLVDHEGYYLSSSKEAFEIVEEIGSPYVKILFDIYHQQITEGQVITNITNNIEAIGHFHSAGNPGRHELDNGELNYNEIFKAIDNCGYSGYVGIEYFPIKDPIEGLRKLINIKKVL